MMHEQRGVFGTDIKLFDFIEISMSTMVITYISIYIYIL